MALGPRDIKQLIQAGLPDAEITVSDLRGDGRHYTAHVVSAAFEGKSRIEQHKMVYQTVEDRFGDDLNALAIQTAVPEG